MIENHCRKKLVVYSQYFYTVAQETNSRKKCWHASHAGVHNPVPRHASLAQATLRVLKRERH